MKKIYTILLASSFIFCNINSNAVNIPVSIGSAAFSPQALNAAVGDVIVWTLAAGAGTHNVASIIIPSGAAAFNSPNLSTTGQTFSYTITTAGTYAYKCGLMGTSMLASFTVTPVGIEEPSENLLTSVYPNPFTEKISLTYNNLSKIEILNVVGSLVKSVELSSIEGTIEMNLDAIPSGIYFVRTYKEGLLSETRKIVKSK